MSVPVIKYPSRAAAVKMLRRVLAMILCLTFVLRMLTLNFSTLCFFNPWDPVDESQTCIIHNGQTELSTLQILVAVSPAMVKDDSETSKHTFAKSSKYPVLLITFLALASYLTGPVITSRLLAAFCVRGFSLRRHLSLSILRI